MCCGTGTAAILPGRPVAGKTGTAQDYTNVYFAGYTPQVATAVWVGFPTGQVPMDTYYGSSVFGGTVAAPIWQDFMARAMQGFPVEGFEAPPAPESGAIPNVVGMLLEEAEAVLVEANFTPIVEQVRSFEPVGTVLSQQPGGGTARLGTGVTLQVSDGKGDPVVVPRLTGLPEAKAIEVLAELRLFADVVRVPVEDRALDGIVVDQEPNGDGTKQVDPKSTVTIYVGSFEGGGNDDGGGRRRRHGGNDDGGNGGDGGDDGGGNGMAAAVPPAAARRRLA